MTTTPRLEADHLVGMPEIADLLGVTLATVQSWRKRGKAARAADNAGSAFPEPIATVATHVPIWDSRHILEWADRTGRTVHDS